MLYSWLVALLDYPITMRPRIHIAETGRGGGVLALVVSEHKRMKPETTDNP